MDFKTFRDALPSTTAPRMDLGVTTQLAAQPTAELVGQLDVQPDVQRAVQPAIPVPQLGSAQSQRPGEGATLSAEEEATLASLSVRVQTLSQRVDAAVGDSQRAVAVVRGLADDMSARTDSQLRSMEASIAGTQARVDVMQPQFQPASPLALETLRQEVETAVNAVRS